VLLALAILVYLYLREPGALEDLQRFAGLSRGHDDSVQFENSPLPPVGGVHSSTWLNCGVYEEPVELRNVLHSLEHGAVWITYQPELAADDVQRLQDLVWDEGYVVLSPYPGLQSPIVLTAWGVQLELESAGDARIADFVERYQQGPQTPEFGASCQDGAGTPINS
jgi:hypothetical protein